MSDRESSSPDREEQRRYLREASERMRRNLEDIEADRRSAQDRWDREERVMTEIRCWSRRFAGHWVLFRNGVVITESPDVFDCLDRERELTRHV